MSPASRTLPLFPLQTVLFPGGRLPLKIFEVRYMDMAKACLKNRTTFGVCLIREGSEVGQPALPEMVGCEARIESWDMRELGVLQVEVRGLERFSVQRTETQADGLIIGHVSALHPERAQGVDARFSGLSDLLQRIIDDAGKERFFPPLSMSDASWLSFRLTEMMPFSNSVKQKMLELTDANMRLDILRDFLIKQKLIAQ